MSTTFAKAPLLEIIAELRWGQQQPQTVSHTSQSGGISILSSLRFGATNKLEEFFMRFGGVAYQKGFQGVERLIPPGFPLMQFQPVVRYRNTSDKDSSVIYQLGIGVFSANGIKDSYRSWKTFAPGVRDGIEALLKSRDESENKQPFSSASLRYINAFGPSLTGGMSSEAFIRDVLGITVNIPNGLAKNLSPGHSANVALNFVLPLANGDTMTVGIAEAQVNNQPSVIMDTTLMASREIASDIDTAMTVLTDARMVIHQSFFELTRPIHHLMQPQEH